MKLIKSKFHGILDYAAVILLLIAPALFGLTPFVSAITYTLAGIHLLLTILTDFPYGIIKVIPYKIHGLVEFIVSLVLIALPWIFKFDGDAIDRQFYLGFGGFVFLLWLLTDYQHKKV